MTRTPEQFELECVLGSIRLHALENKLTPQQVGDIYDRGIADAVRADLYNLRISPEEAARRG